MSGKCEECGLHTLECICLTCKGMQVCGCLNHTVNDDGQELILKFKIPSARHEANMALKGSDYASSLWDIQQKCRSIWKYKDNATEEEIKLAEEIADLVSESGVFEDYR